MAAEVKGRGGDLMNVRRVGKRGGAFDVLCNIEGQLPGDGAKSIEGWVLFVTGLPPSTTEGDLLDLFSQFGLIRTLKMNVDHRECKCIGHALVEYATREESLKAAKEVTGRPFLDSPALFVADAFIAEEEDNVEEDKSGVSLKRVRE